MEITRSYSQKLNLGNYQVADFFCSAKCECDEKDADQKSKELYEFCRSQVEMDIEEYKAETKQTNNDNQRSEIQIPK